MNCFELIGIVVWMIIVVLIVIGCGDKDEENS